MIPIIAGLTNAYCGYMTTREEYAMQWYEGASTHFGPNQLVATQQEFTRLLTLNLTSTLTLTPTLIQQECARLTARDPV